MECLSLLAGAVKRFPPSMPLTDAGGLRLKVPHMGWNEVRQTVEHPLWDGIPQDSRFYFVHSYYADSADAHDSAGETEYARGLPRPRPATICSPCSFTRRKASAPVCGCWRISVLERQY